MNKDYQQFQSWVKSCSRIVFLGGAGVSTESGIPDFRSTDGLYNQKYKYPPEIMISHRFFVQHTEEFYKFYRYKMIYPHAKPNTTHKVLAQLEAQGRLAAVVTQNIDGLHQMAGSKIVLELHGSVLRNYCMSCRRPYSMDEVKHAAGIPICGCGGLIKPDVVLYEEGLDQDILEEAVDYISRSDMLIVGGTSLSVYPAAGLVDYYHGDRLVLINKTATPFDSKADLVIHEGLGEVFSCLIE